MNIAELEKLIQEGYISKQDHPFLPISIYNYTQKCQYEQNWNETTMQCRGLIMDKEYNIISRPFKKFFNLSEHDPKDIPNEDYRIFEKMDGSLGITYWDQGMPYIATKGSFTSDQAREGTIMIFGKYLDAVKYMNPNYTYLFEIIYPENRIVVDYGDQRDLILLEVIDTWTGELIPREQWPEEFTKVKEYAFQDYRTLKENSEDNKEGYVLRFNSGFRVKIKFDEYVRLHRIMTGVSNKTIWQLMSEGRSIDEIIDNVPDEFYNWVKDTIQGLTDQYNQILNESKEVFKELETRKETAEYFKDQKYPSVLFNILDGKSPDKIIWRMIKPKYTKPFAIES